jgi:F-type H+-transporting ATPase subunit epsilon
MAEALPTAIQLEIATPDRQVVHESVESVTVPGKQGFLGILPGHAPLLSELAVGELDYTHQGNQRYLAVTWGFAEVLPDRVIVLVQTAERAEEIDVERAARAKQRAEERLKKVSDTDIDMERARAALARAVARIQTAGRLRA